MHSILQRTIPLSELEQERAAIMEYDGGLQRSIAESLATFQGARQFVMQFSDENNRFDLEHIPPTYFTVSYQGQVIARGENPIKTILAACDHPNFPDVRNWLFSERRKKGVTT